MRNSVAQVAHAVCRRYMDLTEAACKLTESDLENISTLSLRAPMFSGGVVAVGGRGSLGGSGLGSSGGARHLPALRGPAPQHPAAHQPHTAPRLHRHLQAAHHPLWC